MTPAIRVRAIPRLRIETWGTRFYGELKEVIVVRAIPPLPQKQVRGKDGAPQFCAEEE